jgi:hypothetical protein
MSKNRGLAKTVITIFALALLCSAGAIFSPSAYADEGGVSFWLPGQYSSLAATPAEPGWSMPLIYYHSSTDASGSKNFAIGGSITAGLDVDLDLVLAVPTYVFTNPVFGGQASLSMVGVYGRADVDVDATLTGPGGGVLSGSKSDSNTAFGDLYPSASLRWNHGDHNTMVYTMLGLPVGSYAVDRLANIGTNHWSVDAGGGYTYLSAKTGREFSAVLGLTYNFENPDTDYQNGIDLHLDWGASQFLSEQWHVGLVGYIYYQITGDSGDGAILGDFKSRVYSIGPQVGYIFKIGERQAYLNLKGYWEFGAENRPEGWNAWLTLVLPLGGGSK